MAPAVYTGGMHTAPWLRPALTPSLPLQQHSRLGQKRPTQLIVYCPGVCCCRYSHSRLPAALQPWLVLASPCMQDGEDRMNSEQAPLSPAPPPIQSGSVISGTFTAFISMDSILIILCLPIISQWVKIIRAAAE